MGVRIREQHDGIIPLFCKHGDPIVAEKLSLHFVYIIKDINKDKLYDFLRDMEFNRLLSKAISFYGEPGNKDFNEKNPVKKKIR